MELRFSPRTVKEIEDRAKRPITDVVGVFSVGNLALLVEKGAGLQNENEALNLIEKEFAEGSDMINLYLDIMEKLQKSGFLPKALNIPEVRAKMEDPALLQEVVNQSVNTSVTNG